MKCFCCSLVPSSANFFSLNSGVRPQEPSSEGRGLSIHTAENTNSSATAARNFYTIGQPSTAGEIRVGSCSMFKCSWSAIHLKVICSLFPNLYTYLTVCSLIAIICLRQLCTNSFLFVFATCFNVLIRQFCT